jgi:hypothetical protein
MNNTKEIKINYLLKPNVQQKQKINYNIFKVTQDGKQQQKTNNKLLKADGNVQKTNNLFLKADGNVQKTNNKFLKADGDVQKTNNKLLKADGNVQKTNNKLLKADGDVQKTNNKFLKEDGDVQKTNNKFLKADGDVQKTNNKFLKEDGDVQKTNNKFLKEDGDVQKTNNKFLKADGDVQKTNYKFLKADGDVQKTNYKFDKIKNIQKKNENKILKGDMDGFGKEKGNNYTPRFVYLYKQKFIQEAVNNKHDMNGLSNLSGYEPPYTPKKWNLNKNIKNNNNCYSYAVNYKNKKYGKPQPGYFSKFNHIQNNQYKCVSFFKRILNDIPSVYLTSFKQKCKNGFNKAFFAIDSNKNEHDYHFYRQDNNKLWSHKPGTTNVINYDADYKIIKNPYIANRNYTAYNYDKPCFFFCVNNKFGKTNAHK